MRISMALVLFLLASGWLPAQTANEYAPPEYMNRRAGQSIFAGYTLSRLLLPLDSYCFPYSYAREKVFERHRGHFGRSYLLSDDGGSTEDNSKTSVWTEMGYVLAMETVFTGMSYLGSRNEGWKRGIAGGFDLLMGVAGIPNASQKASKVQKAGHYLISAGFVAKSLYNFRLSKNHDPKTRFWTNFVGFNVLVFTGYYLDTLD